MAAKKYNWDKLKLEYITGEWLSLSDFLRSKDLPTDGSVRRTTDGWIEERDKYWSKVGQKAMETALASSVRDQATYLLQEAETFQELLRASKQILKQAQAKVIPGKGKGKNVTFGEEQEVLMLSPKEISALASANDLIAKRLRVNIGLPSDKTEIDARVTDLQTVVNRAYEQLTEGGGAINPLAK